MKISKAISLFDSQRKNSVSQTIKIGWLSEIEYKISTELLEPRGESPFTGFTDNQSVETELLAPECYCEIYPYYLIMKNDYINGEINRYNNSASIFNQLYYELGNYINRKTSVTQNTKLKAGKIYD